MLSIKKDRLLAPTGLKQSLCCVCGQTSSPLYEVRTAGDGYVKFQVYCSTHIENFDNSKNKTSKEIAESYGLQLGEIDHTPPNPWD